MSNWVLLDAVDVFCATKIYMLIITIIIYTENLSWQYPVGSEVPFLFLLLISVCSVSQDAYSPNNLHQ